MVVPEIHRLNNRVKPFLSAAGILCLCRRWFVGRNPSTGIDSILRHVR